MVVTTFKKLGLKVRQDRNGNWIVMVKDKDVVPFYNKENTIYFLEMVAKRLGLLNPNEYLNYGDLISLM
jgi:hypothetical protein